ncbi:DUF305 domain-containing protein [Plantactinospora sp. B6F1]|uniref:DUF305 domain-containing protein n=1 Tax=Plantactinospora sp. B6F1 TaxID=3158971 RepID=UPI0032D8F868
MIWRGTVGSAALLVAVLLAGGCAGSAPAPASVPGTPTGVPPAVAGRPSGPAGTPGPSGAPSVSGLSGPFNGTDIAWLQLAVALHERVLPVLELVPTRSTDPAVRRLAAEIREGHRADIDRFRALLDRSGAPRTNPHAGHDMPGMVTDADLATLGAATGVEFHRLFGRHLRAHLEQSVRVADTEQRSGAEPTTTVLAGAVVRTGRAYLARLDQLAPRADSRS